MATAVSRVCVTSPGDCCSGSTPPSGGWPPGYVPPNPVSLGANCFPPNTTLLTVPFRLFISFTGCTGSFSCLNGLTGTMDFTGFNQPGAPFNLPWQGQTPLNLANYPAGICGIGVQWMMGCGGPGVVGPNLWTLYIGNSQLGQFPAGLGTATVVSNPPFMMTFSGRAAGLGFTMCQPGCNSRPAGATDVFAGTIMG